MHRHHAFENFLDEMLILPKPISAVEVQERKLKVGVAKRLAVTGGSGVIASYPFIVVDLEGTQVGDRLVHHVYGKRFHAAAYVRSLENSLA